MAGVSAEDRVSHEMGMHTEQLAGRTQQMFFSLDEDVENLGNIPDSELFVLPDDEDEEMVLI